MDNSHVARALAEMADIYEIQGANPFKVRALRNAAEQIETTGLNVIGLARSGGAARLQELAGIGEGIARRIVELATTGEIREHEELTAAIPRSLLELLEVSGVGPKKVKLFHESLGVRSLDELELAARAGKVRELARMGEKSEAKLLAAIERHRAVGGRFLLLQATEVMGRLLALLRPLPGVERVEPAGSFRRRRETVGDLDILCICHDPEPVMDRFAQCGEVSARGPTKCSIRLSSGLDVDLRVLPRESFGAALHYFTGSKAHNVAIRGMALKRGLTINEYGVFRLDERGEAGERVGGATEEEVFAAVGLAWIPPELRENQGEIEAAEQGRLPRLIERKDLVGDLHMHTTATDGAASIREMAEAGMARGLRYLAITDHSKALAMTGGLDEAKLRAQGEEVRAVDRALAPRIRVLRGIEVDILHDGALDLAADALGELDVVVASVHSRFEMSSEDMTARMVRAIDSGVVDVIGHPTGRLLKRREPYALDLDAVLAAAKRRGVALEISAQPFRLDLSDKNARLCKERGVKLVIDTDAHHPRDLDLMPYGVDTARRAWLEAADVLNTRPDAESFLAALHEGHR